MPQIPSDGRLESTFAVLRDPYHYISRTCDRLGTDLFQMRFMLRETIGMRGSEAAQLFYDTDRFTRLGASPMRVQRTLFGRGGVQGLDGESHRHRKQMFMALMTPERLAELVRTTEEHWRDRLPRWETAGRLVLYREIQEVLCRGVCAWAGVPLDEKEVKRRTALLTTLFDQAGSVGLKHWQARFGRKQANGWIGNFIRQIRAGGFKPPEQSAAHAIAWHRDINGNLLSPPVAAVELLNILRPTVAVSVYVVFAALALHQFPSCRTRITAGDDDYVEWCTREIRRFYPFFPAVVAKVRHDFEWRGYSFPAGTRVLLDLCGTNHDSRVWDSPDEFRPQRFDGWEGNAFTLIPQGGGDHYQNHRCAGEWITIELLKMSLNFLCRSMSYDVPKQDFRVDNSRLPALPRSHFVIENVRER